MTTITEKPVATQACQVEDVHGTGDKTTVVYHQTGLLPAEQYPRIEEGVSGSYERLAEHLARC